MPAVFDVCLGRATRRAIGGASYEQWKEGYDLVI